MTVISKEVFQNNLQDLTCHDLIHIWHPNCFKALLMCVFKGQTKGFFIYFFLMYAAQYIIQHKKLTATEIKQIFKDYLRSVIFGHIFGAAAILSVCLQSTLLGKLNYYLTSFGIGTFCGITGFLSPKSRFPLEATAFHIEALTSFLKTMALYGLISKNKFAGMPLFMISNALMMFLLWHKENRNKTLKITWIFKPFSNYENIENKICYHDGSCKQDLYKVTSKYFLIGSAFSLIKLILKCFKYKHINIFKLLDKSYLKFPIFFGGYVGIHKAIHCWLTHNKGLDSPNHSLIAGFCAGITYLINPNLSIVATQVVLLLKALLKEMQKIYKLPELNYNYIFFILSCSVLSYSWILHPKLLSGAILKMINLSSGGRAKAKACLWTALHTINLRCNGCVEGLQSDQTKSLCFLLAFIDLADCNVYF